MNAGRKTGKRGQLTVFLIIGIVLLAAFAGVFYLVSKFRTASLEIEEKEAISALPVRPALIFFVEDCLKETLLPAVFLSGENGGIIYPDQDSKILLTEYSVVNYWWINGADSFSREKMEQDLERYLDSKIGSCLGDFETFSKEGIQVTPNYGEISSQVRIHQQEIAVRLRLPIQASLPDGNIISLDSFSGSMQIRMGEMITAAEKIIAGNKERLDLDGLIDQEYTPIIFPFDQSTIIFSLTDEDDPIDGAPLTLRFAVRNDLPGKDAPVLDFIPDQTFKTGDRWETYLTAEKEGNGPLFFSSDSTVFGVDQNGLINLTAAQAGTYKVRFKVEDSDGLKDEQEVAISVLP